MFCEIYLQSAAHMHHHDPLFIYFFYFQVFLTDPRFSIPDPPSSRHPRFPVNLEVLLMKIAIVLSFDHGSKKLFQGNQRFQAIEFVDSPVSEKPDMRFLFVLWTWSAATRVRDSQVQSPKKHIRDTYVTSDA